MEEATQSLYPLMGKNGVDWMIGACSTTAQRGALDWAKKFEAATRPVMEELYRSVRTGAEAKRTLDTCGAADYRERLEGELDEWRNSEMWKAGATVRSLRPENWSGKKTAKAGEEDRKESCPEEEGSSETREEGREEEEQAVVIHR